MSNKLICCNCYYEKIGNEVKNITEELPFVIPDNWTWCRLKSIISLKSGDSIKVTGLGNNGKFPVYGGNGINGYFDQFNVPSNTIIIGRVGFYCGSIHVTKLNSWVTDNALIVAHNNIINVNCLSIFLKALNLSKTSNSTAQPVVSGKGILPLFCPLPPFNEQLKIINQYDKIISKISFLQKDSNELNDIINLSKIKILDYYYGENSCYKSYYENKFTTIGEILQFERGSSPRPIKSFIAEDGINWIKISDGKLNDMYIESTQEKITIEGAKKSRSVSYGELILSNSMSYGKPYILKINGCIHDGWYVFRKNENIDVKFLYYFLISGYAQNQIKNYASGSTVSNISSDLMKKIVITIYDTQTQKLMVEQIEKNLSIINKIKEQLI